MKKLTIFISDKKKFKPEHSHARRMLYTSAIHGATEEDFKRIKKAVGARYVIWKEDDTNKRPIPRKARAKR